MASWHCTEMPLSYFCWLPLSWTGQPRTRAARGYRGVSPASLACYTPSRGHRALGGKGSSRSRSAFKIQEHRY